VKVSMTRMAAISARDGRASAMDDVLKNWFLMQFQLPWSPCALRAP